MQHGCSKQLKRLKFFFFANKQAICQTASRFSKNDARMLLVSLHIQVDLMIQ